MSRSPLSTARRLRDFREGLGLNKARLADEVKVQPLAVLMWEKEEAEGGSKPRAETFIKLAKLALEEERFEDALWLLGEAGVDAGMIDKASQGRERSAQAGEMFNVPPTRRISHETTAGSVAFPAAMISNRSAITYARVSNDFMQPMFKRGDLIILDESEADLWALANSWVAVYREAWASSPTEIYAKEIAAELASKGIAPRAHLERLAETEARAALVKALDSGASESDMAALMQRVPHGLVIGLVRKHSADNATLLALETLKGASVGSSWELLASTPGANSKEALTLTRTPGWTFLGRVVAWISCVRPQLGHELGTKKSESRRKRK